MGDYVIKVACVTKEKSDWIFASYGGNLEETDWTGTTCKTFKTVNDARDFWVRHKASYIRKLGRHKDAIVASTGVYTVEGVKCVNLARNVKRDGKETWMI